MRKFILFVVIMLMAAYNAYSAESIIEKLNKKKVELSKNIEPNLQEYSKTVLQICDWHLSQNDISSAIQELETFYSKPEFVKLPVENFVEVYCKEGEIREWLFDYESAVKYYKQAYNIIEQANITESKQAAQVLVRLCYVLLRLVGDEKFEQAYEQAYSCYEEAYKIWESKYVTSDDLGYDIILLSTNFIDPVDNAVEKSKALYTYCLQRTDGRSGYDRVRQEAARSLANVYGNEEDYENAKKVLEQIENEAFNKLVIIEDLIAIYLKSGDLPKAYEYQTKAHTFMEKRINDIICRFKQIERSKLLTEFSNEFVFYGNNVAACAMRGGAVTMAYNDLLFCNNTILNLNRAIKKYILLSGNSELSSLLERYNGLREQYAYKSLSFDDRVAIAKQLVHIDSLIINSIPNLSIIFREQVGSFKDVEKSLSTEEAAVEFCLTPLFENGELMKKYIAYIIKKGDSSPQIVTLEDYYKIESLICLDDEDPNLPIEINQLYNSDLANEAYILVWSKLEPYLRDCKTIYYTPSSELWSLNFNMLKNNSGELLGNRYNLICVSSTGKIPEIKASINDGRFFKNAVLYGDIMYDTNLSDMKDRGLTYNKFSGKKIDNTILSRSYQERGRWGQLPYTKNEIDSIRNILEGNDIHTTLFTESQANEESLKSFDGSSPEILHLSTHGFVIDTQEKAKDKRIMGNTFVYDNIEDFQLWCGLMLSGGNNTWMGKFNLENIEDGILTADEISRLDLSNTKLVVLSACETGRGKINRFEGVLGLPRALKKAGVQTVVMSLWKVADEPTSILMTHFYKNLMAGIERHQALKDAMNYVKTLYPDPYYWAGFIMLD